MKTKSFRDLIVWQKSYQLTLEVYAVTKSFPKHEMYGLSQQMRRAAVSIPSNIAEGYNRKYKAEYKQSLSIAYGSLAELRTQYLLAVGLKYTQPGRSIEKLLDEVGAMLYTMIYPDRRPQTADC